MRSGVTVLILFLSLTVFAAPKGKTSLRVGTFEVTNSFNRGNQVKKGQAPAQRLWRNSACAVAEAIIDSGCDIIGLQDVCDSIAGKRQGSLSLIESLHGKDKDYDWLILSNTNSNFPLDGTLANANGVVWKKSRFELKDYGILWLSGIYDKPGRDKSLKYGSNSTSVMWVLLYDTQAKKNLVFASTSLTGPTQYDHGKKVVYHEINIATAENLIALMKSDIVPEGTASVIALNAHNAPSSDGYKMLTGDRWFDVHDCLHEEGALDDDAVRIKDCSNTPDEEKYTGGRSDHILVDGFGMETYAVLRNKYHTEDGTMHYPAFHFPVVADLEY